MSNQVQCFQCSADTGYVLGEKISRRDECPKCSQSLHCCKMCKHHDTSAYNECREPAAQRVLEKDKANFCDYFSLSAGSTVATQTKQDLLKAAEALFKK